MHAAASVASSETVLGTGIALPSGAPPVWIAGYGPKVLSLAGRIADALYARLGDGTPTRVSLLHGVPGGAASPAVGLRALLPFDYARFAVAQGNRPPRINLEAPRLVAALAEEYVYAELCEALMLSFAAENEARMQAMIAAQSNLEEHRGALLAEFRRVRQDEITDEIIELSAQRL